MTIICLLNILKSHLGRIQDPKFQAGSADPDPVKTEPDPQHGSKYL